MRHRSRSEEAWQKAKESVREEEALAAERKQLAKLLARAQLHFRHADYVRAKLAYDELHGRCLRLMAVHGTPHGEKGRETPNSPSGTAQRR